MSSVTRIAGRFDRRFSLSAAVTMPLLRGNARATAPVGWRQFELTTRVVLHGTSGSAQLWLPLAQSVGEYQVSLGLVWHGNGQVRIVRDAHYGAELLDGDWHGTDGGSRTMTAVQTVATRDRVSGGPLVTATEAERRFWMQPTEPAHRRDRARHRLADRGGTDSAA